MSGVNKVILVGRLGADPKITYTKDQTPVANFNIATSESWTGKDGNKQEKTEWHRITVWKKLATLCKEYLSKGKQVYIEGKLQTRSWEDKNGQKRYTTEILAQTVQFLSPKGEQLIQGDPQDGSPENEPGFTSDDEIPF